MGQCYSVCRYKVKDTTKRPKYFTNIHSVEGLKADLVEPSHKEHIEETITENNGEDVKPVDYNEQVQQQQAEVEIKDSELLKTRKLPEALKEEQEKSLQEEQDSEGTTMMSTSVRFRQEGNKVYITAKSNIPAKVQLERLQSASNLYYKAYNASANMDEKASSAKNLGMASWRIGQLMEELNEKNTVIFHFYKEAFKYLSEAWMKSCDVKPVNWRDGLSSSAFTVWEEYKQSRLSEIRVDKRVKILYDILQTIEIPAVRAECYVHIGTCHFHAGVTAIQTKNFKTALYEMKECYLPVAEAAALGKSLSLENVKKETETLESDVTMHLCLAESMQANTIGEDLFKKLLMDEENLNMDMVYEIIDWHRQAVLRTREITEVEVEAIALSRIGKVYDKVLKLKAKAKEYLMRSMQLANSMHPRTFHGEEWFEDCKEILAKYQKEVVEQESEVWQKERASLLKELEKELKDLKTNDEQNTNSRSEGFLKFVYKEYPPTNTANKLEGVAEEGPMAAADLKKILQKAIVHYHPDRVDVEKFGKKRKVLSEEITKCLTRRYESFKIG